MDSTCREVSITIGPAVALGYIAGRLAAATS
jgi:hypothetical protein